MHAEKWAAILFLGEYVPNNTIEVPYMYTRREIGDLTETNPMVWFSFFDYFHSLNFARFVPGKEKRQIWLLGFKQHHGLRKGVLAEWKGQYTGWTKKNRNFYKYDSNIQDIKAREN